MALVRLYFENQNKAKHVESELVPRLDEGSSPSSSTINADNQCFTRIAPNFTPKSVRLGVFVNIRTKWDIAYFI